jgi:hypothetical protein
MWAIKSLICGIDSMNRIGIAWSNLKHRYQDGCPGLKPDEPVCRQRRTLHCSGAIRPRRTHRWWLSHSTDHSSTRSLKKNKAVTQGVLTRGSSATCASSPVVCSGAHSSTSSRCVNWLFQGVIGAKTRRAATVDTPKPCRMLQIISRPPEPWIPLRARVSGFQRRSRGQ